MLQRASYWLVSDFGFRSFGFVSDFELCPPSGLLLSMHASLTLLADGSAEWNHAAVCEYCGEGVLRPMRALCRDRYKYVHVEGEKPLLFDLASDPQELTNLHGRVGLATWEARLREEVLAGWDAAGLEQQVRASQRSRLLINEAMALGRPVSWDYQPPSDASKQYVR